MPTFIWELGIILVSVFTVSCIWSVYRTRKYPCLTDLPGPPSESFLLGNLRQLMREQVGDCDIEWQNTFGMVARIKAPLGGDRIWVSDPKAIQYILQTSRYRYVKSYAARFGLNTATGKGVNGAEGEDHYRQRRVLLPAFGAPESKAQLPIFRECAWELCQGFAIAAETHGERSREENIPQFLSFAILNALGLAAFNYDFREHGDDQVEFTASLHDFMAKGFGLPSNRKVFLQGIMVYVPPGLLDVMAYLPTPGLAFLRHHVQLSYRIARKLVYSKVSVPEGEGNNRDALSRIVKANRSEAERWRLSDAELLPQLATILGAGHETTVNTLSWILFELATHPDEQRRLREEIRSATAAENHAGTPIDLDALPLLNAVIKETLRFDTVVPHLFRTATRDDIVPLSKPINCPSGRVLTELCIPRETHIIISNIAYNRNRELWGEDATIWRPDRWLDGTIKTSDVNVGVWANLMSFGSGHRACLGWRFAVTEVQAFLFELVSRLHFEPTERTLRIRRENCLVMLPMVEGEEAKGNQLPLKISLADRTDVQ
ncbi:cytochrome P450 [Gloeopeniophorella convolvens]|nr:cytochrome P450 [Gloeopeniophorella convolvens]